MLAPSVVPATGRFPVMQGDPKKKRRKVMPLPMLEPEPRVIPKPVAVVKKKRPHIRPDIHARFLRIVARADAAIKKEDARLQDIADTAMAPDDAAFQTYFSSARRHPFTNDPVEFND